MSDTKPKGKRAAKAAVRDAELRALQRALREERLALAAIVKVMLIEVPDPGRVLARLDAMTRAAEANPRTPAAIRRQLLDATRFVRTAIERETGRPQTLFEPHVGHVAPKDVDALVRPTDGPQQLGLVTNDQISDVADAHAERVATISVVHDRLVGILRDRGALTDTELHERYVLARGMHPGEPYPLQSRAAICERRKELVAAGRVVRAGNNTWDLVERGLITTNEGT